jgi:hypothetical protein
VATVTLVRPIHSFADARRRLQIELTFFFPSYVLGFACGADVRLTVFWGDIIGKVGCVIFSLSNRLSEQ